MNKFYNPVHIEFGEGSLNFLPRYVASRKALLVTSEGFVTRGVVSELEKNNNFIKVISNIQPNPTIQEVDRIRQHLIYESFDVIVALGGGSVIDVAKAIAPYETDKNLLQLVKDGLPTSCKTKPIIAIPTTAGTGSEVTMWGTLWDKENKIKYSISDERLYCETAILDVNLHMTLPLTLTIQTGADALSHALESLWNKNTNPISQAYAYKACHLITENLVPLTKDLRNKDLREKMLLASYYAGVAFSNTQTAIAHAMSYYMTLHKNVPHGIAATFTLPSIIKEAMLDEVIKEYIYRALGETPLEKVKNLLKDLGISDKPSNYDLSNEVLDRISESVKHTNRGLNNPLDVYEIIANLKGENI